MAGQEVVEVLQAGTELRVEGAGRIPDGVEGREQAPAPRLGEDGRHLVVEQAEEPELAHEQDPARRHRVPVEVAASIRPFAPTVWTKARSPSAATKPRDVEVPTSGDTATPSVMTPRASSSGTMAVPSGSRPTRPTRRTAVPSRARADAQLCAHPPG